MTPEEEKAKKLLSFFFYGNWEQAKQSAIICCDEIINTWKFMTHLSGAKAKSATGIINFWQQVKNHLTNQSKTE
jgi:hypothetical protein